MTPFTKQDPDYVGFNGELRESMKIGNGASVYVVATVDTDEVVDLRVMYESVDIAPTMNEAAFEEIKTNLGKRWQALVQESNKRLVDDVAWYA